MGDQSNSGYQDPNSAVTNAQAQGYATQLSDMLNTQYQNSLNDALKSGNYLKQDDSGLLKVAGGRNRYGELRPDYTLMQSAPGELDPRFKDSLGSAYQSMLDKSLTQGDTEAARLAREQQSLMSGQARNNISSQTAGQVAQARGNLAARGGLRSGAAERLGMQGMNANMAANQAQTAQNQQANLGISMQDEAMKNQMLQQAGNAQQNVQGSNVNRLQQDVTNQNLQQFGLYSEDMAAFAAQQSANAQASANSCFTGDMKVVLLDGTAKRFDELKLGDITLRGGKVFAIQTSLVDKIYNYKGVMVTGSHAVFHENKWVRVRDTDALAEDLETPVQVFCAATENHRLIVDHLVFADLYEVNDGCNRSEAECLKLLNEGA